MNLTVLSMGGGINTVALALWKGWGLFGGDRYLTWGGGLYD